MAFSAVKALGGDVGNHNLHVIPSNDPYLERDRWFESFRERDLRELPERSKKFVEKRMSIRESKRNNPKSYELRQKVGLVLYGEASKLCSLMAGIDFSAQEEEMSHIRDEVAKALAGVTIVLARLAQIYNADLQFLTNKYVRNYFAS